MKKEIIKPVKKQIEKVDPFSWVDVAHWKSIIPIRQMNNKIGNDDLIVGIGKYSSAKAGTHDIRFRMGENILEKCNWQTGDRINFCTHPDDLLLIRLVKASVGWKLARESKDKNITRLQVAWKEPQMSFEKCGGIKLKYDIYKESLIFRLDFNEG